METPREVSDWLEEKVGSHRWSTESEPRRVTHEWRRQMGGRIMQAALTISIEPSSEFSMHFAGGIPEEYALAIRNAALSVLLSQSASPVLCCRIEIESAVVDPNHSSYGAFFYAAKEATEQLIGVAPDCEHNIQW